MRSPLIVLSGLLLLSIIAHARDPFSLSGTVTNTTNPNKPVSASATVSFDAQDNCVLSIAAPLYGSGLCSIETFDEAQHSLTVRSSGPSGDITCTGKLTDSGYQGTYEVDYPNFPEVSQHGNFSLTYDQKPLLLQLGDVLTKTDFTSDGKEFHVLAERDFAAFYD
jgi:hypothetical protein